MCPSDAFAAVDANVNLAPLLGKQIEGAANRPIDPAPLGLPVQEEVGLVPTPVYCEIDKYIMFR